MFHPFILPYSCLYHISRQVNGCNLHVNVCCVYGGKDNTTRILHFHYGLERFALIRSKCIFRLTCSTEPIKRFLTVKGGILIQLIVVVHSIDHLDESDIIRLPLITLKSFSPASDCSINGLHCPSTRLKHFSRSEWDLVMSLVYCLRFIWYLVNSS